MFCLIIPVFRTVFNLYHPHITSMLATVCHLLRYSIMPGIYCTCMAYICCAFSMYILCALWTRSAGADLALEIFLYQLSCQKVVLIGLYNLLWYTFTGWNFSTCTATQWVSASTNVAALVLSREFCHHCHDNLLLIYRKLVAREVFNIDSYFQTYYSDPLLPADWPFLPVVMLYQQMRSRWGNSLQKQLFIATFKISKLLAPVDWAGRPWSVFVDPRL